MPGTEPTLILALDVGGTKTFAGVFSQKSGRCLPIKERRFENSRYGGVVRIIDDFLKSLPSDARRRVGAASIAVAAPVKGGRARLTNLNWTVDARAIKKGCGIKRVELLNDVEAIAWGVALLKEKDFLALNDAPAVQGANKAVISAGTGLGEAILFSCGNGFVASASEGGHADFAPDGTVEAGLLLYLSERFGHVSFERVASGQGLKNVYGFLSSRGGSSRRVERRMSSEDAAAVITSEAERPGGDKMCREALAIFISVLGREAGNLALKAMARGGVYLGGGIPPRILKELKKGGFMRAFNSKGRLEGLMKEFPVKVVLSEKAALYGAVRFIKEGRGACL